MCRKADQLIQISLPEPFLSKIAVRFPCMKKKKKQSFANVMLCCDYENGSKFPSLKILNYDSISYHLKELYKNYLRRNYLSLLFDKKKWSSLKFWHSYRKIQCTNSRSSRLEVFCKKVFLEISQNSQENTCELF